MPDSDGEGKSKGGWLDSLIDEGLEQGKNALLKGKVQLQKAAGLGKWPNVIPPENPEFKCKPRRVEIAWHPVGGAAGQWFEATRIGQLITDNINKYPDPTQHWAVIVGEFAHQLWMDENLDIVYINQKVIRDDWTTFEVGETTFNDEAMRQAGEIAMAKMREKNDTYNLITNNCQVYAAALLDLVHKGSHKKFGTSYAVYKAAIGPGAVVDLFDGDSDSDDEVKEKKKQESKESVQTAQKIMDENTAQFDKDHKLA